MIQKEHLIQLAESFLQDSDSYLIDIKVSAANKIIVLIENDANVAIKDCIALSRYIEHSLDREQEDFELEVSSPGIDQPFRKLRQYQKYIGKEVEVKLTNGTINKGTLVSADEMQIALVPKIEKKKKNTGSPVAENKGNLQIPMPEIKETRLIITL